MSSLAIQTNRLSRTPGSTQVIQSCNIRVTRHAICELLGEDGADKATLFKILAGILTPTSEATTILGYDMITQTPEVSEQIGALVETPVFYEHLSATENLKLHLAYMRMEGLTPQTALTMVGLLDTGKRAVLEFSLGMCQRLAIARALSHRPKLLILDEPISGLDLAGIREIWELFSSLVTQYQMTILLPSHIFLEIEQVADMIGSVSRGRLFEETSLADLQERYLAGLEYYFMKKREEQ